MQRFNQHYIITGEINSGKSTKLYEIFQKTKKIKKISGWISVQHIQTNGKKGYDIIFIQDSKIVKKTILARTHSFKGSKKWQRFWFNPKAFECATKVKINRSDLIIIDEIGPMELNEKAGFWSAAKKIYDSKRPTITVVRTGFIKKFLQVFICHPRACVPIEALA